VEHVGAELPGNGRVVEEVEADGGVGDQLDRGDQRARVGDIGIRVAPAVGQVAGRAPEGARKVEADADGRALRGRDRMGVLDPEVVAGDAVAGAVAVVGIAPDEALRPGVEVDVVVHLEPSSAVEAEVVALERVAHVGPRVEPVRSPGREEGQVLVHEFRKAVHEPKEPVRILRLVRRVGLRPERGRAGCDEQQQEPGCAAHGRARSRDGRVGRKAEDSQRGRRAAPTDTGSGFWIHYFGRKLGSVAAARGHDFLTLAVPCGQALFGIGRHR